jgi:uncharacterized protein YkwD
MDMKILITRLFFSLCLLFSFQFTDCAKKSAPSSSGSLDRESVRNLSTDDMSIAILYYVNIYRRSAGLVPIQLNSFESALALKHSQDMASKRVSFSHDGFQERVLAIQKKLGPQAAWAENIASGRMSGREVVESWIKSPIHKKNLLGNFILTGIGSAKNEEGVLYYTEIFTR